MLWSQKPVAVVEKPVQSSTPEDTRPKKQQVKCVGDPDEVKNYVVLCQKIRAETPAVRMLQLRQFLTERGIPEYDSNQVHRYLWKMVDELSRRGGRYGYKWHPLREEDKKTSFRWWWSRVESACESSDTLYHQLVPSSVLQTVATILEAFPDAKFFVSDISLVKDPFLLVTFPDVDPVIVDFWNEPGFLPS